MAVGDGLPSAVGAPSVLGAAETVKDLHRFRDFWASPGSGSHGKARWQQTMGSLELRLLLTGSPWHGATAEEFQVRMCERGLRVVNTHRPDASESYLANSLNGDFPHEVLVGSSWWHLEVDPKDPEHGEKVLLVHAAKSQDKSWLQPFAEGKPRRCADLSADWRQLAPGRLQEDSELTDPGVRPNELLQAVSISQTDDLVTIRLLLREAKLDEAKRHVPMSRLWALDLTERSIRVWLRFCWAEPLLAGSLGGRILPIQTDWTMMKVTRELAQGLRETLPALSVQLRKAPDCRHEWERVILEASPSPEPLLELESSEAPECQQEHGASHDEAMALKARGDECFRKQDWEGAIDHYSCALVLAPENEKLFANRSAAHMEAKRFQAALDDAKRAEEIAPAWPKSFFRQGMALRALKRYDMAISAFSEGKMREPQNPSWQKEIEETQEMKAARAARRKPGLG